MRWSLARLLFLTAAVSLGLATISLVRGYNDDILLACVRGGYLAVLATASAVAFSSPPKWRRFCLTYSIFGWSWFLFSMRDAAARNFVPTTMFGILLGFACAFLAVVLPGPVGPTEDRVAK